MTTHEKTLRLANLIGLRYLTDDHCVWRCIYNIPAVPWRPYECEADLEPIKAWLEKEHPYWLRGCECAMAVTTDKSPNVFCDAVLAAFDTQMQDEYRQRCHLAEDECDKLREELDNAKHGAELAESELAGARQEVNQLREDQATDRDQLACQASLIERLKTRLHEQTQQTQITATQITEQVCDVLRRYGVLPESLGHPIEQIVGRVVCDLKLEIERLMEERNHLSTGCDNLRAMTEDATKAANTAIESLAVAQAERDQLREQLADIANATTAAVDERCDGYEKHCTCVPLLRSEVKRLQDALADADRDECCTEYKAQQRAEIERLTADLVRAQSDAKTYLRIGQRRDTENEILKATLVDKLQEIERLTARVKQLESHLDFLGWGEHGVKLAKETLAENELAINGLCDVMAKRDATLHRITDGAEWCGWKAKETDSTWCNVTSWTLPHCDGRHGKTLLEVASYTPEPAWTPAKEVCIATATREITCPFCGRVICTQLAAAEDRRCLGCCATWRLKDGQYEFLRGRECGGNG